MSIYFTLLLPFLFASAAFAVPAPVVVLSPTSLTFASQALGTTSPPQTVTMTNTGNAALSITLIKLDGSTNDNFAQTNNCGSSLLAGASCTLTITFTPIVPGAINGSFSIADNAANSPQTVPLSGTGTGPSVSLSPANIVFARQRVGVTSAVSQVTLTNTGNAALNLSSVTSTAEFAQSNTCGASLAAGANCTFSVTFTPAAVWTRSGFITIMDNGLDSPQLIPLAGRGTPNASASLSASRLTFANQTVGSTSPGQNVTLTNNGSDPLNINGILASGDYAQTTTCGASLAAHTNCSVTVTFTPTARGNRKGYVTVNTTDSAILHTIVLTGNGTLAVSSVAVSPRVAPLTPSQTQQFSATINGVPSSNVNWSVDGIAGGNSTVGTISTAGLYTAPTTAGQHVVTATSTANPTQSASSPALITNYAGTFTYHNDLSRSGLNSHETVLTTGNVNTGQFGKLFSYSVDGYVYAQPLYVRNVNLPSVGIRNVLFIATEHDSVYAFDADHLSTTPYWQTSFIDPAAGITTVPTADVEGQGSDITPEVGITSTPVIDTATSRLYVIARTKQVSGSTTSYVQKLHTVDITTGEEVAESPVTIAAVVNGTGSGHDHNNQIHFDGKMENPRPGLLLSDGVVYGSWASLGDLPPYHGWFMGYDAQTLAQDSVYNTTRNGEDGGIWQGGGAPAADANGDIYIITGNGTFDANTSGVDFGESFLRLSSDTTGTDVVDYFTPYNQAAFEAVDHDLGSGGPMLLPDQPGPNPHLMIGAGKDASLYLVNRDNMGQFSLSANNIPLYVPGAVGSTAGGGGHRGVAAYWQGQVYFQGSKDVLKAFTLFNGLVTPSAVSAGTATFAFPGGVPCVSANGNLNGIVWDVQADQFKSSGAAVLHAYDAANVSRELYNSSMVAADIAGAAVKYSVPTVANGKVYLGTQTGVDVYGLLP